MMVHDMQMDSKDQPPWSEKLKEAREAKFLTQEKLAELLKTDARTVRGWEKEGIVPSMNIRPKVLQVLGKTLEELRLDQETISLFRKRRSKNFPDVADDLQADILLVTAAGRETEAVLDVCSQKMGQSVRCFLEKGICFDLGMFDLMRVMLISVEMYVNDLN